MIAAACHDLLGDGSLRPNRIDCDDRSFQIDYSQDFRNGSDFIGFLFSGDLCQGQSEIRTARH